MLRRLRMKPSAAARQDGGFALITTMIFLVVILILGSSFVNRAIQELHAASRVKKDTASFNLAEAGIDYAAWRIYNGGGTSLPVTWTRSDLPAGSFTVTARQYNGEANVVELTSVGVSDGWTTELKVVGRFLQAGPGGNDPIFGHAVFSDADFGFNGNCTVRGHTHGNGKVTLTGSPTLDGNLSAAGSIVITGNPNITGTKTPNAARISMPTIDVARYRSIANRVIVGNYNFNGDIELDGVTFIDGSVTINGNFHGKGVIVTTGRVTVNGNCTLSDAGSELAIITTDKLKVNGNCRIEGFIYAHNVDVPGPFEGSGNATIVGGIVADLVSISGSLDVTYRAPTVEMPGSSAAPPQFDAISWRRVR